MSTYSRVIAVLLSLLIVLNSIECNIFSSLLRVCVTEDTQMIEVACLAVYIRPNWVVMRHSCIHDISTTNSSTYLVGGNTMMDCDTGEKRDFDIDQDTFPIADLALVQIDEPFRSVPTIRIANKRSTRTGCSTFCSWKMVKLTGKATKRWLRRAALSEVKDVCRSRRIIKYDADITPCGPYLRKKKKKPNIPIFTTSSTTTTETAVSGKPGEVARRRNFCFKHPELHVIHRIKTVLWFPAILNSPLLCDGGLMGFFDEASSGKTPNFMFLHDYRSDIKETIDLIGKPNTHQKRKNKKHPPKKKPKKQLTI